jgi:hypothetical protein
MAVSDCFAHDRKTARRRFQDACQDAGVSVTPYFAPHIGQAQPDPIIEVVRIGNRDATNVLALTGGSWEDEGLCASGIQTAILRNQIGDELPEGVGLVLIHAIAPVGLSGLEARSRSWPAQPPRKWTQRALAAAEDRFASYIGERNGPEAQETDEATPWQAQLLCRIADTCFRDAERIALLDIRTGPGKFGDAEIFACTNKQGGDIRRAAALFGTESQADGPFAGGYPGEIAYGLMVALERSKLAAAVLEFGTYSMLSVLTQGRGRTFYPDSEDWRENVWRRSLDVTRQALRRLAEPDAMSAPSRPS